MRLSWPISLKPSHCIGERLSALPDDKEREDWSRSNFKHDIRSSQKHIVFKFSSYDFIRLEILQQTYSETRRIVYDIL